MGRKTLKSLDKALEKKYKSIETKIMKKGDEEEEFMVVPTFSAGLNYLVGNGGVVLGKIITISGPESSGKTAVGFTIMAAIQKNIKYANKLDEDGELITKGNCILVDTERSYSKAWTEKLGVDTGEDCFRVVTPESGEMGLDIIEDLVRSGSIDMILLDSLNALLPEAVIENDMGDSLMGAQARMYSKSFARLVSLLDKYKVLLVNISQERETMDMYKPVTLAGGNATKFYSSILIRARRAEWLGANEKPDGIQTVLKATKNKLAIPKRSCSIDLKYKTGFSFISDYVASAVTLGIVERSGAWFTIPEVEKPVQGLKKVEAYYEENKEKYDKLVKIVNERMLKKDYEERGILEDLEKMLIPEKED